MLRHLRVRRAARRLHEAHPEIPLPVARTRAWTMIQRYPHATTERIGEYLIHQERVRIMLSNMQHD